jgi:hypothetical protein
LDNEIRDLRLVNGEGKLVRIITESDVFRMVVQGWSTN